MYVLIDSFIILSNPQGYSGICVEEIHVSLTYFQRYLQGQIILAPCLLTGSDGTSESLLLAEAKVLGQSDSAGTDELKRYQSIDLQVKVKGSFDQQWPPEYPF